MAFSPDQRVFARDHRPETVTLGDITVIILHWDQAVARGTKGDLNRDAVVNMDDIALVLARWGERCG